jgi:hypothetical protein
MKKKSLFLAAVLILGWFSIAMTRVWVNPYTREDGTHVEGHYRSNPDGNPHNNWSYPGNVNPYTGKQQGAIRIGTWSGIRTETITNHTVRIRTLITSISIVGSVGREERMC